jgi:hypothetical protein
MDLGTHGGERKIKELQGIINLHLHVRNSSKAIALRSKTLQYSVFLQNSEPLHRAFDPLL